MIDLKGIRVFARADLNAPLNHTVHMHNLAHIPTVKHLINNGARVSSYFVSGFSPLVTKKIEDMTYQLTDAHSIYWQSPLSRVSGFATVAVTLLSSRSFCSRPSYPINKSKGPSPIDYRYVLQEDEFHKLADSTIHDMLEKLEEYGDSIDIDGFDIDYGNEVLTLKLGNLGTYVLNKQTPNRQIWLSSPVSGPSRFDWDPKSQAWIYRRNQANLFKILESEIEKLCGQPLNLS